MPTLTARFYTLAAAFLANLCLAAFVGWRYRKHRLHRLFSFSVAGWAGYSLFLAGLAGFGSQDQATAWIRSTAGLPHLCILTFYRFAMVLGRAESGRTRLILSLGIVTALADVLGRLSGFLPINLERHESVGWLSGPDPFYSFVYMPVVLLEVGGGLTLLFRRWRRSPSALERTQLAYAFLAMGAGLALALTFLAPGLALAGAFAPVAYTSVLAYAITQRRLLDIRILLRRGVVAAGIGASFALIAFCALLLSTTAWRSARSAGVFAALLTAVAFTIGYDALRQGIQRLVDRVLGLSDWEPSARLLEFSLLAASQPRLEPMLEATAKRVVERFGVEHCAFLLADRGGQLSPGPGWPRGDALAGEALSLSGPLAERLLSDAEGIELEALGWTRSYEGASSEASESEPYAAQARDFLNRSKAQAAFGIRAGGKLLAVLLVGPSTSGRAFSDKELRFFSALASQLATSVENASLHVQMQQADRLSALGTLAASLTHELRNPLSTITSFLDLLSKKADPAFKDRFVTVVGGELGKLMKLTEQLLNLAKPARPVAAKVELCELSKRVRALLSYQYARKNVRLTLDGTEPVDVSADEAELSQVMLNLLLNALDATPPEGEVRIRVRREGGSAHIEVSDSGKGMTEEARRHLFEPFYTTKEQGTGLGLSICLKIVQGYGGRIEVASQPGQGSVFAVQLPLAA